MRDRRRRSAPRRPVAEMSERRSDTPPGAPARPVTLGQRLADARAYMNLPAGFVARRLELRDGAIEDFESDRAVPDEPTLRRLAELYAHPLAWLTGEIEIEDTALEPGLAARLRGLGERDRFEVRRFAMVLANLPAAPKAW